MAGEEEVGQRRGEEGKRVKKKQGGDGIGERG